MSSPEARVNNIAARLAAIGLTPRVTDHDTHTSIETEVPDQVPTDSWREFLAALAAADWWGISIGSRSGRLAWAAVNKEPPGTADAVRGHGHQP